MFVNKKLYIILFSFVSPIRSTSTRAYGASVPEDFAKIHVFQKDKVGLDLNIEQSYWNKKIPYIIGVDEAGRGCLAGPVVSAAACIHDHMNYSIIENINDSKTISEKNRYDIYDLIQTRTDITYACSVVDHTVIDDINILAATMQSMSESIHSIYDQLSSKYSVTSQQCYAIIDGNKCPTKLPITSKPLVKGDSKCYSIALASIIAKVTRDKLMIQYDELYPQYGFKKHKGYPTKDHILAIHQHGPCPIHRLTFKPLKGR